MKRYLCIGGYMISRSDGDEHYISPYRLAELYGVDPAECVFASSMSDRKLKGLPSTLRVLSPRYDGNYSLLGEQDA